MASTLDKTIEYEYNTNTGNLESVTTRKGSGTPTTTTFGYDSDRLTSFGGKAITYNANGGVASYDGWNYTWSKGKLSSIRKNLGSSSRAVITPILGANKTYSFSYNGLGQRVRSQYSHFWLEGDIISVHQGEVTAYTKDYTYDHSGRLICEDISKTLYGIGNESSKIVYLYDESGIVGMQYSNDTTATTNTYYFLRNLQGDVIAIYDTNGAEIASYSYDAWGNCTINSTTTNYSVAHANPIRYRGYYYDEDTKLYYLNSRYYSPEFRRFISPDDTAYLDPETPNGLNLYCYCNNDPVNYADPSGHLALVTFGFWAIVGIVSAAMVLGGGAQLASNALAGNTGSDLWRGVTGAALGSGANALSLCLLPATWGGSLAVSAFLGAGLQTGVDNIETLIRGENVSLKQTVLDLGINFVTTFIGNWLGSTIVPTNAGWFKTQRFDSVFLKPYGQRILAQTSIGAGVSGMVNFERKFNWGNMNRIYYMPSILSPILPTYLYN